ncbi:hypothetical protein F4859DRAFT_529965 [Xylaria cf. heliscus]|nr:hypothetical protein F4859DRAFT_529965 [Xylaria cf. heliscus]
MAPSFTKTPPLISHPPINLVIKQDGAMDGPPKSIDQLIAEYASISKLAYRVTIGVFFGIALLSVLARAAIRLRTQRRFALDDYLLFIAAAFLTGTTGLAYYICDAFYLATIISKDGPAAFFQLSPHQGDQVLDNALLENIFLVLAWTATFSVKFSFLAFFKQMIFRVDRIRYYYWSVVVFTVISYLFLVGEAFILCHEWRLESLKCFDASKNLLYVSFTGLITGLDVLTDILIVSIPIILLRRTNIRTSQKAGLGVFLCLSIVMISFALTRVSKIRGVVGIDIIWEFFWQYMETAVAVIMGSLTVVRSLLVYQIKGGHAQSPAGARPLGNSYYRLRFPYRRKKNIELESQELPSVPSATMTGLRTFIRRNNRDVGLETQATGTVMSDEYTLTGDDGWHSLSGQTPSVDSRQVETLGGTDSQDRSARHPYEGSSLVSSRGY